MIRNFSRILPRALTLAALAPLAACGMDGYNRSVESVHQPAVTYSNFAYDVGLSSNMDGLGDAESIRLVTWLDSLEAGYGDVVSIAGGGIAAPYGIQRDIARLLAQRGVSFSEQNQPLSEVPPAGAIRLILRRATASVPGCPDWSGTQEGNMSGGSSSNFGCGVNGNLAAMVADPNDLIRGRSTNSDLRGATSSKAVESWQKQAPTGSGGLKDLSAGGN